MINSFIFSSCISTLMYLSIMNKFKNPTTGRFFINNNDHKQILHKQRFFVKQGRKKATVFAYLISQSRQHKVTNRGE